MKELIEIFEEPFKGATMRDYFIASLPITMPLVGIAALAIDHPTAYVVAVVILFYVAYLIKDLK